MIDVKGPLRTAYIQRLSGFLIYNAVQVPVSDSVEKLADTASIYVLLTQQNGISQNNQAQWNSQETMTIDIVNRGQRVNKAVVDNIASQIFTLLFPSKQGNALPVQSGVSFSNMNVTDDRYLIFQTAGAVNVTRRLITITQLVTQ